MIRLRIVEPNTTQWNAWRHKARAGHADLRAQLTRTGTFQVDEKLYKEMKETFFQLYHGKCAYCETKLRVDGWDQLDHYRPKNAVLGIDGKTICCGPKKLTHPGYYWLAYEWTNLIPICALCNNRKGAKFPLLSGSSHATRRGQEGREKPVFIHPVLDTDDPVQHFEYIPKTGFIKSKSERGRLCIELLKLNRSELVDQRRAAYRACVEWVCDILDAVKKSERALATEELSRLTAVISGAAEYALVGRKALRECKTALKEVLSSV